MLSLQTFGLLLAFTRISLSFAEEERGWLQKRISYAAPQVSILENVVPAVDDLAVTRKTTTL